MRRRQYLSAAGVFAFSGCSQIPSFSKQTETQRKTPTTPTPAQFVITDVSPKTASVGDTIQLSISVKNVGDQDGVFQDTFQQNINGRGWETFQEIDVKIPAGAIQTLKSQPTTVKWRASIKYRFKELEYLWELNIK